MASKIQQSRQLLEFTKKKTTTKIIKTSVTEKGEEKKIVLNLVE